MPRENWENLNIRPPGMLCVAAGLVAALCLAACLAAADESAVATTMKAASAKMKADVDISGCYPGFVVLQKRVS